MFSYRYILIVRSLLQFVNIKYARCQHCHAISVFIAFDLLYFALISRALFWLQMVVVGGKCLVYFLTVFPALRDQKHLKQNTIKTNKDRDEYRIMTHE